VLERLSPTDDPPYPAYQALAYLLERGVDHAKVVRPFRKFSGVEKAAGFRGNPFLAQYAELALRFLPELAMNLVRRALRSDTAACVGEMASLLAAIDQPWCLRELASALEETPGGSVIAEALRRSSSELATRRAAKLYVPPTRNPSRRGYTWEEVRHHGAASMLDARLEAARPLAEELRTRYPPTWDG
jgi:hypothetical protein